MANAKVSALTAATTPLAGTEVLPIVQSGVTVKVANNDLRPKQIQSNATTGVLQVVGPAAAATRVMTTPNANFTAARTDAAQSFTGDQTLSTGNLIFGTSGKGVVDSTATVTLTFSSTAVTANAPVVATIFKTSNGTTSAANNTFTTIYTAPTLNNGTYIVSCNVAAADPTNYSAVSLVTVDATVLRITALQTAGLLAIQISGQNIQARQQSGATANILWTVTRVS